MAVISRRPRLTMLAICTLSVIAAACSLVKPVEAPADKPADAARLAAAGRHAEAAQAYTDLAAESPADHDSYELLSAEQWVAAGNVPLAKQAYATVSGEARTRSPTSRALVAAEIALADNDAARALRELDTIPVPGAPELAQNYWYIRGVSEFLLGHPAAAVQAYVERERYLTDTAALKASREDLFGRIRNAAEHAQPLNSPANAGSIVAGWLALGPVAVELQRDPMHAAAGVERWQRLFPGHPANDSVLPAAQTQLAVATEFPDQIALLLPLSGRAEAAGTAVRDGFIAAYLEQPAASRPRLKIYDVTAESVAAAYQHAIQDGASFVVGPLTKEDVAAIAPLSAGKTPVLALNFLSDSVSAAANFYQFALLPEDEARIVARRLVADGRLTGVAILPEGELGTRVGAAFADELKRLGGTVLDTGRYPPGRPDFTDVIRQTLQVRGGKGEPATHRTDANFVFVSATPTGARLIVSQLKFHYAGDIPVYSTSDSFEPDPSANNDLDGLTFPDMPWMVSGDAVTAKIRDEVRNAWPTGTARRDRLYAFGFDAYRLVPALRTKTLTLSAEIAGVTGKLHLDDHNRIRRDLDWAQIRDGVPAPL
jgi:outer membrane PBP1 activator LpoA protein